MSGSAPPSVPVQQEQLARRVIRLIVAGLNPQEIATTLGVKEEQVKILTTSPMFQAMVKVERQKLREQLADSIPAKLEAHAEEAVDTLVSGMRDADEWGHKLRAAENILDRGSYPKRTQVEHQGNVSIQIDAEQKAAIETAFIEAGLKPPGIPADAIKPVPESGLKHIDDVLNEPE